MKRASVFYRWAPLVLSIIVQLAPTLHGSSQILNGDFELGNTNFTSNYQFEPTTGVLPGLYGVHTNSQQFNSGYASFGDHTSGKGKMMLVDGNTSANKIVWSQTVSVTPSTLYKLSAWATAAGPDSPAVLRFAINGTQAASDFPLVPNPGLWQQFVALWGSGTNTAASISITDTNLAYVGNDFALDDISFSPLTNSPVATTIYPAVELAWSSQSNQLYQVQYSTELDTNLWLNLGAPIQGTGTINYLLDSTRSAPRKFYRVLPLD